MSQAPVMTLTEEMVRELEFQSREMGKRGGACLMHKGWLDALLADRAALIAENEDQKLQTEAARAVCLESQEAILGLIAERDQLRDEVESLGEDAERYRWLRGHHGLSLKGHDFISYGEVADFRIDNAMTVVKADG